MCVNLVIEEDGIDEAAETVILRIANNNNWPEFRDMSTVTIVDNGKPSRSYTFYNMKYCTA